MDGSLSETVRAIRITGKPGKVGTPAYAIDRVPRRETRLGPRTGLPDGRTPASRRSSGGTKQFVCAASSSQRRNHLLGLMSATAPTIPIGRMHMRPFQLEVIRQVRAERNGNAWIPVIDQSVNALKWWTHIPHWQIGVPFQIAPPQEIMFTDAFIMGWGVAFQRKMWSGSMAEAPSSHQLVGAQGGFSCPPAASIPPTRQDSSLHDRQRDDGVLPEETGGTRSRALLKLSMRILRLAHRLQIGMVPRHIAGQLNVLADLASRTGQVIPSEWSLATESFQWIVN